jgi:hypothetical protein
MGDWNTRLELSIGTDVVTPIESFTPTFTTGVTPIHSIEADNVGAIYHPQTATFTMTVQAIGPITAVLTRHALEGTKFNLTLAERRGTEWTFSQILFRDCVITSAMPSSVVIDGPPKATFAGIILGFRAPSDFVE